MDYRIVYDGSTDIESYQVIDTVYGGRPARVLYDRDRRAAQSGKPLDDNDDMLFDYNERCMELVRGTLPKRMLILGGGACTLPQAVLSKLPDIELDIVELDAGLIDIAEGFFDFIPSENTQVHITDARSFVAHSKKQYDLIIIDVYTETSIPLSLQTVEAASELHRSLRPNGIIAMNIIAAYYGQRSAVLKRQIAAWSTAFGELLLVPASAGYSLWLPQNFVLIAQQHSSDTAKYLRHAVLDVPATVDADITHD